jgi:hypothetical protein
MNNAVRTHPHKFIIKFRLAENWHFINQSALASDMSQGKSSSEYGATT